MTDRGVSTVVGYILVVGIVALLTATLITGFAPFVTNQQHNAVHSTLEVLGNDLAGDIDSADRLATEAGDDGTVELRTRLPSQVGGSPYTIGLLNRTEGSEHAGYHYDIELRSTSTETTATVRVRSSRPLESDPDVLSGGILTTERVTDADASRLVIRDV